MMKRLFWALPLVMLFASMGFAQAQVNVTKDGKTITCPCVDKPKSPPGPAAQRPAPRPIAAQPIAPQPTEVTVNVHIDGLQNSSPPATTNTVETHTDDRLITGMGQLVNLGREGNDLHKETNRLLTTNNQLQGQEIGLMKTGNDLQKQAVHRLGIIGWTTGIGAAAEVGNLGVNINNGITLGHIDKNIEQMKTVATQPPVQNINISQSQTGASATATGGAGGQGGQSSSNSYGSTATANGGNVGNVSASQSQNQSQWQTSQNSNKSASNSGATSSSDASNQPANSSGSGKGGNKDKNSNSW